MARVGCTNVTDRRQTDRETDRQTDRQTDGRRHIVNMNVSLRSLKIVRQIFAKPSIAECVSRTIPLQRVWELYGSMSRKHGRSYIANSVELEAYSRPLVTKTQLEIPAVG